MGLDISFYRGLRRLKPQPKDDESAWDAGFVRIYDSPGFKEDSRLAPLTEGYYEPAGAGEGFRAGSYGGYNEWRRCLAQLALGMTDREVWAQNGQVAAFGELIHFSDCEGTLGPKVCKKLAKDFKEYADRIKEQLDADDLENDMTEDGYFWSKYQEWQAAFEYASDKGCVCFH